MHNRTITGLGIILLTSLLIVFFLRQAFIDTAALYPAISDGYPYLVTSHWLSLYLLTPLVITAALMVLLMPGVMLAMAHGKAAPDFTSDRLHATRFSSQNCMPARKRDR